MGERDDPQLGRRAQSGRAGEQIGPLRQRREQLQHHPEAEVALEVRSACAQDRHPVRGRARRLVTGDVDALKLERDADAKLEFSPGLHPRVAVHCQNPFNPRAVPGLKASDESC